MKNKIAIGLGLMFSLTAGISFADSGTLQVPATEVNAQQSIIIDTSSLTANNARYDITCYANNLHQEEDAQLIVSPSSHPNVNMGPVLLNDKAMHVRNNAFVGKLNTDKTGGSDNKIVFQQFTINGESAVGTYINVGEVAKGSAKKLGLFGFVMHDCTYTSAQDSASNGIPKQPKVSDITPTPSS